MELNEDFLCYLWQFQYFSKDGLTVSSGEKLQIIHPGTRNNCQGPDFSKGCVEIDSLRFIGNIELHVRSSDWHRHGHHEDSNYTNVILHVVWENDHPDECLHLPVLSLKDRVPLLLLENYRKLMGRVDGIPCAGLIKQVSAFIWENWKDRLLAERLQEKGNKIRELKSLNNLSWEEAAWRILAKCYGGTVNGEAFQMMAEILELKVLYRYREQLHRLEALLLGTSGLLEGIYQDHYPIMLQREYEMLKKRHSLKKIMAPVYFLRMRPSGFPTIRLSQLAGLIFKGQGWITLFTSSRSIKELRKKLEASANDYWNDHYLFDKPAPCKIKYSGQQLLDSLIINVALPIRYALAREQQDTLALQNIIEWLSELPAEKNHRLDEFCKLGLKPTSARDSQALLQLKNTYCERKHCLNCAIGNQILKGAQ